MSYTIALVILLFLAGSPGFGVAAYEVVTIEIVEFDDLEVNLQVAREIVNYPQSYMLDRVPDLRKSMLGSISFGADADSSDGDGAFVWIRYDYNNEALIANKDAVKRGLREYFLGLADSHAQSFPVFRQRGPNGVKWLEELLSSSGEQMYEDLSSILKSSLPSDEWQGRCRRLRQDLGAPRKIEFIGARYYEAYGSFPENLALFYQVELEDGAPWSLRISETREDGEWRVVVVEWFPWGEG